MLHPESWHRYFDHPAAMLLNFSDPTLIPRYLHFTVSSLAVGGLAIALYFRRRQIQGEPEAGEWVRYGCNWFGYATFVNFALNFSENALFILFICIPFEHHVWGTDST